MHIKYFLPLAAASLLLSSAAAFADVDTTPAAYDWSGFYVGAEGSALFSHTHFVLPGDTHDALQQNGSSKSSFTGGGLAGYNYQSDNMVFGVEGDISSGNGTSTVTACAVPDGCFVSTHDSFTTINHVKTNWGGNLRARFGFANGDNLVYVAAGYSYADSKMSLTGLCYNAATPTVPTVYNFSRSENLSGFNLGAGIEHAFDEHFVARAEYVYADFGGTTYPGSVEWNDRRIATNSGALRLAVAYRF